MERGEPSGRLVLLLLALRSGKRIQPGTWLVPPVLLAVVFPNKILSGETVAGHCGVSNCVGCEGFVDWW